LLVLDSFDFNFFISDENNVDFIDDFAGHFSDFDCGDYREIIGEIIASKCGSFSESWRANRTKI
jgi:hypothetical protein